MKSKVSVKKSKIQGRGVYASTYIQKGEAILIIDDSHVVNDVNKLTPKQHKFDCDYLSDGKIILMQEPEIYINHSCNPTSYVKTINGKRHVIAMKDIKEGEEITFDYVINGMNNGTFKCSCGAKNCRGVYQGNFFNLPIEKQREYLPYLEDWFKKEHIELVKEIDI